MRTLPSSSLLPLLLALAAPSAAALPGFPEDPRELRETVPFDTASAFLGSVGGKGPVTVSVEARSPGGRPIHLVRLDRGGEKAHRRLFFYAQQHGDEVAGKDAMLYLIRDVARDPALLPKGVELWLIPTLNPDGAAAGTRRNAAGADLNRDHILLDQPETLLLHRVAQRIRPHLSVDCHEFGRDPESFAAKGWRRWPVITMDSLNHPLFDPDIRAAALRWVEEAAPAMKKAGHPYLRYTVGGVPPEEELRHSTSDLDDGRNGLGAYGGLSFIIESGMSDLPPGTPSDLSVRVDAYRRLLWRFVTEGSRHAEDLAAVDAARARPLPDFLPVNYFWANPGWRALEVPVLSTSTGKTLLVPTRNFMDTLVVKKSVPTPSAYAVDASSAALFAELLDRHAVPYETLAAERTVRAETCRLLRVEEDFDELYGRYEGRQIVSRGDAADRTLPAGSLIVPLRGESAIRAALLLEPTMLYGLYQYPKFRALAAGDGTLPVLRLPRKPDGPQVVE